MRKALSALSLLLATPLIHAADASLALSNKTVTADYTSQPIGQGLEVTAGLLHHSDNGNLGSVGLQVSQKVNEGLDASLGGKLVFVQNDVKNAWALALGGQVDWALPAISQLHLGLHGWYAPKVTSFNGANNLYDIGASVSYRVLSNAEVFAAYRRVRVDYERQGGKTIQSGPLFGMKLFF
jgi:YfaZ precursor